MVDGLEVGRFENLVDLGDFPILDGRLDWARALGDKR